MPTVEYAEGGFPVTELVAYYMSSASKDLKIIQILKKLT